MKFPTVLPVVAVAALAACSPRDGGDHPSSYAGETPAMSMTAEEAASVSAEFAAMEASTETSAFTGKWTGPEGTSLTITPQGVGGHYTVTVTNLDGPRTFQGEATADGIAFTRDGRTLTIHKGSGADTGMKWLADKNDCVVVDANEGYCRD